MLKTECKSAVLAYMITLIKALMESFADISGQESSGSWTQCTETPYV